jgi:hypothetical protein
MVHPLSKLQQLQERRKQKAIWALEPRSTESEGERVDYEKEAPPPPKKTSAKSKIKTESNMETIE